jgi:hypothetical protein
MNKQISNKRHVKYYSILKYQIVVTIHNKFMIYLNKVYNK